MYEQLFSCLLKVGCVVAAIKTRDVGISRWQHPCNVDVTHFPPKFHDVTFRGRRNPLRIVSAMTSD